MYSLNCFKSYDIRGIVPEEINATLAYLIGRAFATLLKPKTVVVGHDIRLSGPDITRALAKGLTESGVDVIHIGQCGTEEVYYAVPHFDADGGICVTASHNPANYNGMKFVGKNSTPIGADSGLLELKRILETQGFMPTQTPGQLFYRDIKEAYAEKLLSFVSVERLSQLKIVVNPGNGGAGAIIDALEQYLPFEFIKIDYEPDGNFPNGVPNPLLSENRKVTSDAVLAHHADLGIAWDGDFDRCFFFDEEGQFIEGYYLVGLIAKILLENHPDDRIVYDPRLLWNTVEEVKQAGGHCILSRTGHAFIKAAMRENNALYGGEMSAHHYFRDFHYCDNGNIPWLLICQYLSNSDKTLSELVSHQKNKFPCSGEINLEVHDADDVLKALESEYGGRGLSVDKTDGLSVNFSNWRFNVRASNTEPLLRVNLETKANPRLLTEKTDEVLAFIKAV